jgi:hypothetical protein
VPRVFWDWVWICLFCAVVGALGFEALTASQEIPNQLSHRSDSARKGPYSSSATLNEPHSAEQTGKRNERQAQAAERAFEFLNIKVSDALIAIFTIVLAVKTAGLFEETAGLRIAADKQSRDMEVSIKAAQKSAEAAMISAQTSKAAIRGVIAIKNFKGFWRHTNKHIEGYGILPNIENVGNSHVACYVFASSEIIDAKLENFVFEVPDTMHQAGIVSPGTKIAPAAVLGFTIDDAIRIWNGEAKFLYYCRVNYFDIFGEPHHVECCMNVGFRGDPRMPDESNNEFLIYSPYGPQNSAS